MERTELYRVNTSQIPNKPCGTLRIVLPNIRNVPYKNKAHYGLGKVCDLDGSFAPQKSEYPDTEKRNKEYIIEEKKSRKKLLPNYEHAHFQHRAEQLIGEKKQLELTQFISPMREIIHHIHIEKWWIASIEYVRPRTYIFAC